MAKSVLVPIGKGSEEIEAVSIVDTLRRAGANVTIASVENSKTVEMSRHVVMMADKLIDECVNEEFDLIAVPGGMPGAERCRDSEVLTKLLKNQKETGRYIAAICASPAVVLETHKLLENEKAVAYPSFMSQIKNKGEGRVVISNKIVTSIGPGSALEFSIKLIEVLYDKELANKVKEGMCIIA